MDTSPSTGSHSALIALVSLSLVLSLGAMGLLIRQQNQANRLQRELISTLVGLRVSPTVPTSSLDPQATSLTNSSDPVVGSGQRELAPMPLTIPTAGKVLATSPDRQFVIRGVGACSGEYGIDGPHIMPVSSDNSSFQGSWYEVSHPGVISNDAGIGEVAIQSPSQYSRKPAYPPKIAFQDEQRIVTYSITEASDCSITISPR